MSALHNPLKLKGKKLLEYVKVVKQTRERFEVPIEEKKIADLFAIGLQAAECCECGCFIEMALDKEQDICIDCDPTYEHDCGDVECQMLRCEVCDDLVLSDERYACGVCDRDFCPQCGSADAARCNGCKKSE